LQELSRQVLARLTASLWLGRARTRRWRTRGAITAFRASRYASRRTAELRRSASGCAFAFDPDCDKVARINYVGVPLGAVGVLAVRGEWLENGSERCKVEVKRTAPGVVEVSANLAQHPTAPGMFFLMLLLQLGHLIGI
jgi:hypothetical protein